jgi:hypothetical protein
VIGDRVKKGAEGNGLKKIRDDKIFSQRSPLKNFTKSAFIALMRSNYPPIDWCNG